MRILTIETSTLAPAVQVLEFSDVNPTLRQSLHDALRSNRDGGQLTPPSVASASVNLSEFRFDNTSRMLIPLISESLRQAGLSPRDIDLFVVALGPGSFTGLRMGVVAAKAFAYATGCKLIGVDIMTALAYDAAAWHAPNDAGLVCPMIDIGRGEVLAAFYQIDQQHALRVREPQIFQPADLAFNLCSSTVCIGSGLKLLRSAQRKVKRVLSSRDCPNDSTDRTDRLEARSCGGLDSVGDLVESAGTTDNAVFVPDEFAAPRITTIARLGLLNFLERGPDDLFKLEPIYSRPSAAEEIAKPATGSK